MREGRNPYERTNKSNKRKYRITGVHGFVIEYLEDDCPFQGRTNLRYMKHLVRTWDPTTVVEEGGVVRKP